MSRHSHSFWAGRGGHSPFGAGGRCEAGRTGLVNSVGKDHVFMSVEEAVRKLGPGGGAGDFG